MTGGRIVLAVLGLGLACQSTPEPRDAVILVTLDGLRWQDLFRGADSSIMDVRYGGVPAEEVAGLRTRFWRDEVIERRRALMPFFWSTVADGGAVYGNVDAGSVVRVMNDQLFSYPGYNEILTGYPDSTITSNDKIDNPNITVLEWINAQPGFRDRVAAFGSWDVFPYIINEQRSGVLVDAGWYDEPLGATDGPLAAVEYVSRGLPRLWSNVRFDAVTIQTALEYYRLTPTQILYVALDETDTQAHARRYDLYLDAMHRLDRGLQLLWEAAENHPAHAGRTTLIVTSDHGRGRTGHDWTDHGAGPPGADEAWVAVLGPYAPARGVVVGGSEVTLGQVAATVAAAVGLDYRASVPDAEPAIPGAISR